MTQPKKIDLILSKGDFVLDHLPAHHIPSFSKLGMKHKKEYLLSYISDLKLNAIYKALI